MKLKTKALCVALAPALGAGIAATVLSAPAAAQQTAQRSEKIEITGSNIRRVEGETALPVTVIRADDLRAQGVTNAEEALQRISANQNTIGTTQAIGASTGSAALADLRGLGATRTLVLLNGRRIANQAYTGVEAPDLNMIPVAALDRIEILRDGASAVYGSDAIGGVINFITKRDFTGGEVSIEIQKPERSGGGDEKRATASLGFGNLSKQGFNVLGIVDWRKQDALAATERDFASTGIFPQYGVTIGGTSGTGFPANFTQPDSGLGTRNPFAPACAPELGTIQLAEAGTLQCRFDFTRYIDLVPENERKSFFGKATFALGRDTTASLEYLHSELEATARVAATPLTSLVVNPNNPYFPGMGSTPAVTGVDPTLPIVVAWRPLQAGQRTSVDESIGQRLVFDLEGVYGRWDWRAGAAWSKQTTTTEFTNGYLQRPLIVQGLLGTVPGQPGLFLNPFGTATDAELAYLESVKVKGRVLDAEGEVKSIDAKVGRELFNMAGGPAAIALGAEYRKEKYTFDLIEENARPAASSGLELAEDITGKRDAWAIYAEMNLPVMRNLEIGLALRHDDYELIGSSTNPKVSFRWQPTRNLLVRGSANTGFRAPSVYDLFAPTSITFTANPYNDPVLCPGGTPAPGADAGRDCSQQFRQLQGGNTALDPEESRTQTIGVVFEPTQNFSIGLDYWRIKIKDTIGAIAEQIIFANPGAYGPLFVRCGELDAATRAVIDPCALAGSDNALAYIVTTQQNLGGIRTNGWDVNLNYRQPLGGGRVALTLDGTYVNSYKYQRERFDPFVENVGRFVDAGPIFRWQHVAMASFTTGPWNATLVHRYKRGYRDANFEFAPTDDPSFDRNVGAWSVFDVSVGYTGWRGISILAGVKNVADKDPPFSNQGTTFQRGYDPRFTDPYGRTYFLRLAYSFR